MEKIPVSCSEVDIPYPEFIRLRSAGRINLGVDNALAAQISNISPMFEGSGVAAAFHFWIWVAVGVFVYSIYDSVTSERWWAFIAGALFGFIILKVNKTSNAENLLDRAMRDETFYEQVREMGGWRYEIDESYIENVKS